MKNPAVKISPTAKIAAAPIQIQRQISLSILLSPPLPKAIAATMIAAIAMIPSHTLGWTLRLRPHDFTPGWKSVCSVAELGSSPISCEAGDVVSHDIGDCSTVVRVPAPGDSRVPGACRLRCFGRYRRLANSARSRLRWC